MININTFDAVSGHISTSKSMASMVSLFKSMVMLLLLSALASSFLRLASTSLDTIRSAMRCGGCHSTNAVHGRSNRSKMACGSIGSAASFRISSQTVIRDALRSFCSKSCDAMAAYDEADALYSWPSHWLASAVVVVAVPVWPAVCGV